AVKEFLSDIEIQLINNKNTLFTIKRFLAATNSNEPEMNKRLKSFEEFMKAAQSNNPHGQYLLGYCYGEGIGVFEDKKSAVYWKQQAAKQRVPSACYYLACHYHCGRGIKKNALNYYCLLQKAAERGHLRATLELANAYNRGFGTSKDKHKSMYWLSKVADGFVASAFLKANIPNSECFDIAELPVQHPDNHNPDTPYLDKQHPDVRNLKSPISSIGSGGRNNFRDVEFSGNCDSRDMISLSKRTPPESLPQLEFLVATCVEHFETTHKQDNNPRKELLFQNNTETLTGS
ncbi:4631_t:CDS:2, partial [Ambispora leptoticha]